MIMYARLSSACGWQWSNSDGSSSPFVLKDVYRYAGMLAGNNPEDRVSSRPVIEFDALSHDGVNWLPVRELLAEVPWEGDDVSVPKRLPYVPVQRGHN